MSDEELMWADATEQAALVRRGEVSPLELVDAAIARIERLNPLINSVIHERFEDARREAASPDLPEGPLRGVPFLLKDLGQMVAGEPHTMGSKLLRDMNFRAPVTTYVAQKFINSGVIRLGVSTAPEFGASSVGVETSAYGQTRNPWDLTKVVGASSGGAGAAVAAGLVSIAHANDAGGSIRIPASFCGLVGLKPSRGRSSLGPLQGESLAGSQEEGVLARTVRDVALGIDVAQGYMPGDAFRAPRPVRPFSEELNVDPGRLRVGVARGVPGDLAPYSADVVDALDAAVELVGELGHEVVESHPDILNDEGNYLRWVKVVASTFAAALAPIEQQMGRRFSADDLEPLTWELVQLGDRFSAKEYVDYIDWRNSVSRRSAQWWQDYDVLILPTVSAPAPSLGEWQLRPGESATDTLKRMFDLTPFTHMWNATGQPVISLPLHTSAAGLPVGISFVAAYGGEDLLFRLASQIESSAPWSHRHPVLA